MSRAWVNPTGGGGAYVQFVWFRWGGGAEHGKTHVYAVVNPSSPFVAFSTQCVVDDLGTLVPAVQAGCPA